MTPEEMQSFGKDNMDKAMNYFGSWSKGAQAIAAEVAEYSKKSVESSSAAWEKLLGTKSLDKAMEVQSEYLKTSYEGFVSEATKLSEMYVDFFKDAYKPFEGMAKSMSMK